MAVTPVVTLPPVAGRPQPPIYPLIVGNNGGYLAVRSSSSQGSCGVHSYPCRHPGVDVNGPQGTPVRSPEDGTIVANADGSSPPWSGYGPWLVVVHGDASGKFHLLAHLDPSTRAQGPVGRRVRAGDQVGTVSSARHTHWELRRRVTPGSGQTNFTNGVDPIAWLTAQSSSRGALVLLGAVAVFSYLYWRR